MSHNKIKESWRSVKEFEWMKSESAERLSYPVDPAIQGKLQYYAGGEETANIKLDGEAALRDLIVSEGLDPQDYKDLFRTISNYVTVFPNQFLLETNNDSTTQTKFRPDGPSQFRLQTLAGKATQAIKDSNHPIHDPEVTGLDHEALADYVDEYVLGHLGGPFGSILDLDEQKPILILNDLSYTNQQLFRAFSTVWCDFTPVLPFKKTDFMAFTIYHEDAHRKTKDIIRNGPNNQYVPGIEYKIQQDVLAHENLKESIADTYAALKHIQRTGDDLFPKHVSTMRMLAVFGTSKKSFVTDFGLKYGGGNRSRSATEYHTTPALDEAIARGMALHQNGKLQTMSDQELLKLAINISSEFQLSAEDLNELCAFATSLTFNALRETWRHIMPPGKDSISPYIVKQVLNVMRGQDTFQPKGADAIEGYFRKATEGDLFSQKRCQKTNVIDDAAARYDQALKHLEAQGVKPYTQPFYDFTVRDLTETLKLKGNQTPNMTLAREINDSMAGRHQYTGLGGGHFNLVGVRIMLDNAKSDLSRSDLEWDMAREYGRAAHNNPNTEDVVLQAFHRGPPAQKIEFDYPATAHPT